MFDVLEMAVVCGEDPRKPVRSYAYHNVEDEDTASRYEHLTDALHDGWQITAVEPSIQHSGQVFKTFWLQRQRRLFTTSGWTQCFDPEEEMGHGVYGIPEDERNVLVFMNGHVDILDQEGRQGGPHGIRHGWFDQDKRAWRVNGKLSDSRWVTHWHELPPNPEVKP